MQSKRFSPERSKQYALALGAALGAAAVGWRLRRRAARKTAWNRQLASAGTRTALVTGASSGIGAAYARLLAAQGWRLVLVARREDRLAQLAAECEPLVGAPAEILPADLSTEAGIARVEQRLALGNDVDFLVNNAGYDEFGPFAEIPIERTLALINCLALASVRLTRAALPGMLGRRHGAIVNVSSVGAYVAKPYDAPYLGSKAFINLFSESLAAELAGTGVRVQTLCPGFTLTEFHDAPQYVSYRIKERIPRWLWMTSEAVAAASLRALGEDRRVCVPGWMNRAIAAAGRSGLSGVLIGALRSFFRRKAQRTPAGRRAWVEHWSRAAGWYDEKVRLVAGTETCAELRQKLAAEASAGPGGSLGETLELGCGTGNFTAVIAPLARRVTAVDLSPELLAAARAKLAGQPQVDFRLGDIENLDLPTGSFDTILLANVLPVIDAPKVLEACAGWLRPGGRLLILYYTFHGMAPLEQVAFALRSLSAFGLPPRGRRDYSPAVLSAQVRRAGFTVEQAGLTGRTVKAVYLRACRSAAGRTDPLALLACPDCRGELAQREAPGQQALVCTACGKEYPVLDGLPRFIRYEQLDDTNRNFARFYDWFSYVYLPFSRIGGAFLGGEERIRRELLDRLEPHGGRVLEVSIGPGVNLPYLVSNPAAGELYGLDISIGQLRRCRSFARRRGYPVELYLGNAEALPFKDESFESVFHIGGINFFSDKARAIAEMTRVAKPGAKILIADETERGARGYELGLPGFKGLFERKRPPVRPPVDLVPAGMEDVTVDESVWRGWFYSLEFRKPGIR